MADSVISIGFLTISRYDVSKWVYWNETWIYCTTEGLALVVRYILQSKRLFWKNGNTLKRLKTIYVSDWDRRLINN